MNWMSTAVAMPKTHWVKPTDDDPWLESKTVLFQLADDLSEDGVRIGTYIEDHCIQHNFWQDPGRGEDWEDDDVIAWASIVPYRKEDEE